jgi:hypothetical protein
MRHPGRMRMPTLWLGLAALLLWVATAVLTVRYDGNGSPVGQGLVTLLAIIATIGFISTARRSLKGRSRQ